jgi:hypothetical protein
VQPRTYRELERVWVLPAVLVGLAAGGCPSDRRPPAADVAPVATATAPRAEPEPAEPAAAPADGSPGQAAPVTAARSEPRRPGGPADGETTARARETAQRSQPGTPRPAADPGTEPGAPAAARARKSDPPAAGPTAQPRPGNPDAAGARAQASTPPATAPAPATRPPERPTVAPGTRPAERPTVAQGEERGRADAGAASPGEEPAARNPAVTPDELLAETAQPKRVPAGPDGGARPPEVASAGPSPPSPADERPGNRPSRAAADPEPAIGGDPLPIPGAEITFQSARVRRFLESGGAALDGRVVDADTDKAVGGAEIEAWMGTKSVEGETDPDGRFRFEGLVPGSRLTLWITAPPTYVQERTEVVVPPQRPGFQGTFKLLNRAANAGALDGGAGFFLSRRGSRTVVTGLAAFGPAEKAGVRVGDAIMAVGRRKVGELGPGAIDYLLRGPIGSELELTVQTGSEPPRKVLLRRSAR